MPLAAVSGILGAFDRYDLVAFGEAHRNQNVHDVVLSLIRAADFPQKVNDIVVEFGNARYQSLVDRYVVDGADVSIQDLRRVWRDAVNILVWDAPVYERFFAAVREVNRHLPAGKRMRVLLGDPPFDWNQIQSNKQWEAIAAQRNSHAADLIMREVVGKHQKALMFFGSIHVTRERAAYGGKEADSLTEMLEHRGQKVFVIWPEMRWGEMDKSFGRFGSWPTPSIALIRDTWFGNKSMGPPGTPTLQALADAFLYLGPVGSLRQSVPSAKLYADAAYLAELKRRDRIQGGFNSAELKRLDAANESPRAPSR